MKYLFVVGIVVLLIVTGCTEDLDSKELIDQLSAKDNEISILEEEISNLESENKELKLQIDSVDSIYSNHYHFMETVNNSIYMILESGDSESDTLIRKLMRYSYYEEPFVLYESKGLDFRVSPNEQMIAIDHSSNYETKVSFVDGKGELLHNVKLLQFEERLSPRLYGWSNDGRYFWGTMQPTYTVKSYFIVDTETWKISYIDNVKSYSREKAINTNNGWVCYSDYPLCLDIQCKEEFLDSGRAVTLWLYNIFTDDEIQIDSSITKKFNPVWIDENIVEYDSPLSDDRMRYVINEEKGAVNINKELSSIMDFIYIRMIDGDNIHFSKDIRGLSDVEIVNLWIEVLIDREENYGMTEDGDSIVSKLKANSITEKDNQVTIDFNDDYLEFDKAGAHPGYFNSGLKYIIAQITDAEVMHISVEGDDSIELIHPDGLLIRDLPLDYLRTGIKEGTI